MIKEEKELRNEISRLCFSLFSRGYCVGTAGNVSVRLSDGSLLMTPTNSSFGNIVPECIAKLDANGNHVSGDKPSKEIFLHQAFYATLPHAGSVVHLHSTWATAISCMKDIDPEDCIPPITPYVVMRVGTVKLLPYVKPGDPSCGDMIRKLEGAVDAVLLANHGPVVSGKDLRSAVYAAEELEETAKLVVGLKGHDVRYLTPSNVDELKSNFGKL